VGTGADGSGRGLFAGVGAESSLVLALSQVAARAFVCAIGTVQFAVAHGGQVDATTAHTGTLPLARVASQWRWATSVACVFIRVVAAVVFAIADVSLKKNINLISLRFKSK